MGKKVVWNESMLDYIREHYADEPASDIADVLGVADSTVSRKAKKMGLKKNPSFKSQNYMGRYTRKGNKGNIIK